MAGQPTPSHPNAGSRQTSEAISRIPYEMPEISIETSRNSHGYGLKAEDIFWCYQGILRTGDLRESDDEQALADICASILSGEHVEASGDFLNRVYSIESSEYADFNARLATYGRDRLATQSLTRIA